MHVPISSDLAVAHSGHEPVRGLSALWFPRGIGYAERAGAPLLERVLAARGGACAAPEFLDPKLSHLHDPSLMPGVDDAAARLLHALHAGERVVIYGDYDVDGMTATAILYHTIRMLAPDADVRTFVPHRIDDGYGLSSGAVEELAREGARLIVTVDCGITAAEPARVARELGVDLVITDHHTIPRDKPLPDALALVHPGLAGSAYPFPDLCGAGVAYKLAWRLLTLASGSSRLSPALRQHLLSMLALVSMGVVADVVPLVGENRVLARHGLRMIRESSIEGLRALVVASGLEGESVQAEDVGFKLGPRLNAIGRLGHARVAVELLTTATGERARQIASELCALNDQRRRTERSIADEACGLAEALGMTTPQRRAIVLSHPGWHAGVVGICCSRLVERFHRPAILLREHEGVAHGSGRSVDGVDLHEVLSRCASHLTQFGGHAMAAGLRLPSSGVADFREAFIEEVNRVLPEDRLTAQRRYDAAARLSDLGVPEVAALRALAPFGRDNPSVSVMVRGVRVASRPELMGKNHAHLALHVSDPSTESRSGLRRAQRVVGWGWGDRIEHFRAGSPLDLLVEPSVSSWNGSTRVELTMIDARVGS